MKHIFTTFKQLINKPLLVALGLLAMSGNAWGNTATLAAKSTSVKADGITFKLGGNYTANSWLVDYTYISKSKEATLTWTVPDGYTINVSQIAINAAMYRSGGSGQYKTSKKNSYATFCSSTTWTNYTLNSSSYFGLGNDGSITLKAVTRELDFKNIVFTYTKTANTYTIKFDGNGSTSGSTASVSATYDQNATLTSNGFEKRKYRVIYNANGGTCAKSYDDINYTFTGWSTTAGGSKAYDNGATVKNLSSTNGAEVPLFAVWGNPNQSSVTLPNVTKSGYVLEGWYNGTTKVGEAGDSYTPSANVTLTANLTQKFQPEMSGANTNIMVDGVQTNAFTFNHAPNPVAHITVKSINGVNNGNGKVIEYDAANNRIIAHNAGVAEIYFTQEGTSSNYEGTSAKYTYTVYKYNSTFASVANLNTTVDANVSSSYTLTYTKPNSAYAGAADHAAGTPGLNEASGNFYYTLAQNVTATNTTGSPDPSIAITYNASNKTATGKNAGTGTIHLYQRETYKYNAADASFVVTVTKNANPIKVNNTANLSATVYYGKTLDVAISSPNGTADYTVVQNYGAAFATYDANNGHPYVQATYEQGAAQWTISQDETYKYAFGSTTLTVNVQAEAEATDCYVLTRTSEETITTHINSTGGEYGAPIELDGPGAKLKFQVERVKYWGASSEGNFYVDYSLDGESWSDDNRIKVENISKTDTWYNKEYDLPNGVKSIRFESAVGSTGKKVTRNVYVTRKTYLNADDLTIDRNGDNYIFPDETGSAELTIDWSCANGGDLKLFTDNEKFRLSQTTISNVDCKNGSTTVTVYYDADEAQTETAHLYIANSVYKKTVTLTGVCRKHDQTITWKNGVEVMQLGATVNNPASAILDVTYSSGNEDIVQVSADGKSLIAVGEGSAEITATAQGNKYYEEVSDTKTFQVTDQKAQYIVWSQSLIGLRLGDADITLNAYATSELECTTNGHRAITYTSDNESVAIIVDGNKLRIVGEGSAYITAVQAGGKDADGHDYVAATAKNKVLVSEPSTGCHPTLNLETTAATLFSSNTNKPQLQFDVELNPATNGQPKSLSFACKRTKFAGIWSSGDLIVAQKLNGEWVDVQNFGEPTLDEFDEHKNVPINRNATAIRFYRPQGGTGYHDIANVVVDMAQYIEAAEPELIDAKVGETKVTPINVHYSGLAGVLTFHLTGRNSHFSIDKNAKETSCGSFGSELVQVSYRSDDGTGTDLDSLFVSDGLMTDTIVLHAQTSTAARSIIWNIADEQDIYTVETSTLSAECKTTTDVVAGTVLFRMADGSTTGTIENNVLSFDKSGVAIVEAYVETDVRYEDAEPVTKTFNVVLTPTQISEAPTAKTLVLGNDATHTAFLAETGLVTNTVNGGTVAGTFAGISGDVDTEGMHTIHYLFTPDEDEMYATCEGDIDIRVANCIFEASGNWEDAANWTTTDTPENEDVIIAADAVINTDVVVNDLSFNGINTITIKDNASLTVNGETQGDIYGNIIVEAGGQLNLGGGQVRVNDFTLFSNFDDDNNPKSGQVTSANKLTAHGDAYFILDLDSAGVATYGWYGFTVPFPVDALHGIARYDNGEWKTMVNEKDYAIMDYHEDLRAQGKYGWKKYRGVLQPGTGYILSVDDELLMNRCRFKMAEGGSFNTEMTQSLTASGDDEINKGWNSIGNGTLTYVSYESTPRYAQLLDHKNNVYRIIQTSSNSFVVGAAYFVQALDNSTLQLHDASSATTGMLRAPQREHESAFCSVNLSLRTAGQTCDNMFVTCDDDASATYTIGKDVQKMGATTGAAVARMWAKAKGTNLGAVDVAYSDNKAIVPLSIYAPKAGEYTLSVDNEPTEDVYLTRDGIIVWDLGMSEYTLDMSAGTDDSYALLVVRRVSHVATGVEQTTGESNRGTDFVEKMIVNGQLFILRDGQLYDAQGKKVTTL